MNIKACLSSATDEWATPQAVFDELDREFHFTLDPCANEENHKCEKWFSKADNGLSKPWRGETVFCNPPYGKELPKWVKKCYKENEGGGGLCYVNTGKNRHKMVSRIYL